MNYWLMKSEPTCFSIQDLAKRPQQIEPWDGVRNYQARNFLQAMKKRRFGFFLPFELPQTRYRWHHQNSEHRLSR